MYTGRHPYKRKFFLKCMFILQKGFKKRLQSAGKKIPKSGSMKRKGIKAFKYLIYSLDISF